MAQADLRERARQGDLEAITRLLNRAVIHKHLTLTIQQQGDRLHILATGEDLPDAATVALLIRREVASWKTNQIARFTLCAQQKGSPAPVWTQEFEVTAQPQPAPIAPPASRQSRSLQRDRGKPSSNPRAASQQPSRPQAPLSIQLNQFDPMKLGFIGLVAIYGYLGSADPYNGPFRWLHYPDLAIHETGHLLFFFLFLGNRFMHILGGSLTQILFPAAFVLYFFLIGQRYSSALTVFWLGQNFMDVSVYVKDAQARELPLTVDDIDAHDWYNLLTMTNTLEWDQQIGGFIYSIGALVIIASIFMGIYYSRLVKPEPTSSL